ncbi:hypothetical protein [Conservatibacter flavescens]|uniref:Uncharacterized protein n=1 Tax=Conservatibacter flavescens TaxID=28161 RepID=A0A2M8S149_9PAST|nr:hypothetical protein [Conservatibacter flavescens]PJG84826.1 hypothetical protein CVP05_09830 [Conservatibacter flavescens]
MWGVSLILFSVCTNAQIKEGQICHADAELSPYNYAGLWEKFEDGWICNYWQFLNKDDYTEVEIQTDTSESNKNEADKSEKLMQEYLDYTEDEVLIISN